MSGGVLNVGLAILARNEAERNGQMLSDLGKQTLLADERVSTHVFVVANGCTDRTAEVARQALAAPAFSRPRIGTSVHELAKAGKSNAWNELVHRIAPKGTDYMFFLDADIRIPESGSMKAILDGLASSPEAVVAIDRSVKDIELEQPKTLTEKLIKLGTGTAEDTRLAIAGACYCVRFSEVERIWMPVGLPGEDGFLRAMLLTSSFTHEERLSRHLFIKDAYHIFESLRDAGSVVRHNVRLAIGTAINILLFWHLREIRASGRDVAEYIQERNASDPKWVDDLVRERLKDNFFPLHTRYLLRRFRPLIGSPVRRSFGDWLIALFGTSFDLVVFLKATLLMRKGAGAGYW